MSSFHDLVDRYGDASKPGEGKPDPLSCPQPPGKWFGGSAQEVSSRSPFWFNRDFTEARLCDPDRPDAEIVLDAAATGRLMGRLGELPRASDMWFDCENTGTTYDLLLSGPDMVRPLRFAFEDLGCHRISDGRQLRAGADGLVEYIERLAGSERR